MVWIILNAQWAIASGNLEFPPKELSVSDCKYTFEQSLNSTAPTQSDEDIFPLYRISYMWYTFVGCATTILVSGICSVFFGCNDPSNVPSELLTPCIRKFFAAVDDKKKVKF